MNKNIEIVLNFELKIYSNSSISIITLFMEPRDKIYMEIILYFEFKIYRNSSIAIFTLFMEPRD